jgi:hypothetical protein
MKRILAPILIALTFTVMFSSTSFAGWTKVGKDAGGNTYYLDFERIRKHGGYVYWWDLSDLLKPTKYGDLSGLIYKQGDCKLFRFKVLSDSFYTEPMGQGKPSSSSNKPDKEWRYSPPNSSSETILKSVCAYAK